MTPLLRNLLTRKFQNLTILCRFSDVNNSYNKQLIVTVFNHRVPLKFPRIFQETYLQIFYFITNGKHMVTILLNKPTKIDIAIGFSLLFNDTGLEKLYHFKYFQSLTLSRRKPLSYRNQSIALPYKSMDWVLYDRDLLHKRVNAIQDGFFGGCSRMGGQKSPPPCNLSHIS